MDAPTRSGPLLSGEFPATQWSLVLAARSREAAAGHRALAELCGTYWRPLYAYVRRRGFTDADAKDLTQDFFVFLLEHDVMARADRERGRFRTFLLASLRHFLADAWDRSTAQKRGGGAVHLSWDQMTASEESDVTSLPVTVTAEVCFDTTWARMLAQRALDRVRGSYEQRDRGALFEALRGFLTAGDAPSYAAVGAQFSLTEAAVTSSIHRLRQDYRTALRQLVAQTVRDSADVDDELRYLLTVLTA